VSDPFTPNNLRYSVTYSLSITGNQSAVTQLTYRDTTRTITVDNPTNGWSVQVSMFGGTTVGMSAQGTVDDGTIEIRMHAVETSDSGGGMTIAQDSCAAQGLAQPCSLIVADYTLPN
jgi:hypothetical protein